MTGEALKHPATLLSSRAWYSASAQTFAAQDIDTILGTIARNSEFAVESDQRDAWIEQIRTLQVALTDLNGHVFLEFSIPRMGKRVDAVLLAGPLIFAVEFKATTADRAALNQVWDYGLDLKNFHAGSHAAAIVPLLVAAEVDSERAVAPHRGEDGVFEPVAVRPDQLRAAVEAALKSASGTDLQVKEWESAPYRPTPTIIEAARALYQQHGVEAIARSDSGARNLAITSGRIREIVDEARARKQKAICFVTGVPGAGKTLVGLNVTTRRNEADEAENAVFLSGNGPLVNVLREALTRDEFERRKRLGEQVRKGRIGESVKAFIQNVHHFRDDNLQHSGAPVEHVAVFDEAQRAWNLNQTANFMRRKRGQANFDQSEPEFLISCMDRHPDWAVVVCLVGGGQEINTGEAGIDAWLEAAQRKFGHWNLHISSNLTDSEYAAGGALERARQFANCTLEDGLHLSVSMRYFRADNVANFVKAVLDLDVAAARDALQQSNDKYPLLITRDLAAAKSWLRQKARGTERYGLVCSSKAQRLKPHAIDVRYNVDPIHWFLNDANDTRSSYYLEDAATEFQVQGLELDWACVTWDADLRFAGNRWSHHDFKGANWQNIKKEYNQRYLLNAYRVLLTRARQGMVIFVPPGERNDPTRNPDWYDATFEYLKSTGISELR